MGTLGPASCRSPAGDELRVGTGPVALWYAGRHAGGAFVTPLPPGRAAGT